MTTTPPNKSSSSPTESPEVSAAGAAADASSQLAPGAAKDAKSYAGSFAKGCGCVTVSLVLAVGVALVGRGEIESVGSALVGVLFVVLIMGTSGLSGWWNKPR